MYILEDPKPIKPKPKTGVCELEQIKTNQSYTRSKQKLKLNKLRYKSSCRSLSPSRLDPNLIDRD